MESDLELVISSLKFKIKAKRQHPSLTPRRLSCNPPDSARESFKETLSAAYCCDGMGNGVEETWVAFRDAMGRAYEALPEVPPRVEAGWVTDEHRSLTRKKRDAWLRLSGNTSDKGFRQEYQRLRKLTKSAAEIARNSWWSEQAAEAERLAGYAERAGQRESLIKEHRLLKSRASKPCTSTLLDRAILAISDQILARWVEHFELVMNCGKEVSKLALESLPGIFDPEDQLYPPPNEEEISMELLALTEFRLKP